MSHGTRRLVLLATAAYLGAIGIAVSFRGSSSQSTDTIRVAEATTLPIEDARPVEEVSPPEGEPATPPTVEGARRNLRSLSLLPDEGGIAGRVIESDPGDRSPGSWRGCVIETDPDDPPPDSAREGAPVTRFTVKALRVLEPGGRVAVAEDPTSHPFDDPRGAFEIRGMMPGCYYVMAEAHGFHPSSSPVVDVRSGEWTRDLEFTLDPMVFVSGRVVDRETGKPIPGASVRVAPGFHGEPSGPLPQAKTGPDGEFLLILPPGGGHSLHASCEGYVAGSLTSQECARREECTVRLWRAGGIDGFAITSEGAEAGRAVWVQPLDPGSTASRTELTREGRLVVRVGPFLDGGAQSRTESIRKDGYFRFEGLAPGGYSVGLELDPIAEPPGSGSLRSRPPIVTAVTVEGGRTARVDFQSAKTPP